MFLRRNLRRHRSTSPQRSRTRRTACPGARRCRKNDDPWLVKRSCLRPEMLFIEKAWLPQCGGTPENLCLKSNRLLRLTPLLHRHLPLPPRLPPLPPPCFLPISASPPTSCAP